MFLKIALISSLSSFLLLLIISPSPVSASPVIWHVSITPGAWNKTTDAYDPNPLYVSTIDQVLWSNDDVVPHTVTSGTSPSVQDGKFDSLIILPNGTYTHQFGQPGDYPYFCQLHPWMVGTVVVHQGTIIGGEILGTDMTSLLLAGTFANAFWMVPILIGMSAAVAAVLFVRRKQED